MVHIWRLRKNRVEVEKLDAKLAASSPEVLPRKSACSLAALGGTLGLYIEMGFACQPAV